MSYRERQLRQQQQNEIARLEKELWEKQKEIEELKNPTIPPIYSKKPKKKKY